MPIISRNRGSLYARADSEGISSGHAPDHSVRASQAEKIFADPEFRALQRLRSRLCWGLATIMMLAYFGFILVIAFYPEWLAVPLGESTVITREIPAGVGVIGFGFLLTGIYVAASNLVFDTALEKIVARIEKS